MSKKPTYEALERRIVELEQAEIHRNLTMDTLKEKEAYYRELFVSNPNPMWIYDLDTLAFLAVNNAAIAHYGYTHQEFLSMTIKDIRPVEDLRRLMENIDQVSEGLDEAGIWRHAKKDKSIIEVEITSHVLCFNQRRAEMVLVNDITERKTAERALRRSENRYRAVSELTSDFAYAYHVDRDGQLINAWVTGALTSVTGYERKELMAAGGWGHLIHHDELPIAQGQLRALFSNQEKTIEYRIITKVGHIRWMRDHARPIWNSAQKRITSIEGAVQDITEQKNMERMLQQAQKMEAIGTLASGIAHNFNNLLMGIEGRASLLLLDLDEHHPHVRHLTAIQESINSAVGLTSQLLGLARKGKYKSKPIDLKKLVFESAEMFGSTRKEIQVHTRIDASDLIVEADQSQIEQVFLNLFVNAWQAMPDGGDLYLEVSTVTLDESVCKPHQIQPGRYSKISVADTGIGMNKETCKQIFDPFFTTKTKEGGTGLGLASAYGIINNHGGMISVSSEVGRGTRFCIYLPVSIQKVPQKMTPKDSLAKGSERILIVDDEDVVLNVGSAMLERLGYKVVASRSGHEAVAVVAEQGETIDLVILDMVMPGMGGDETFDAIREIKPGVPIMISSGYSAGGKTEAILRKGGNGFIQKPFDLAELSRQIRSILDATEP